MLIIKQNLYSICLLRNSIEIQHFHTTSYLFFRNDITKKYKRSLLEEIEYLLTTNIAPSAPRLRDI